MNNSDNRKILIFTQCDMMNYGNRLQNIGLSYYLTNNFVIEIFNCFPSDIVKNKSKLFYPFKKTIFQFRLFLKKPLGKWLKKYVLFKKTTRLFGIDRSLLLFGDSLKKLNTKYHYFLLGSDQVVNSDFGLPDQIVSFYKVDKVKRISYAISSGNEIICESKYPLFLKEFPHFDGLSFREELSAQQFPDAFVQKHIDPSFLLTKTEWLELSSKFVSKKIKNFKNKNYVFVYWLGNETASDRMLIEKFAKSKKLDVVYLRTNSFDTYKTIVDASPFDFVYLISNAQFVISKSFHGCAMSIILNKLFFGIDKFNSDHITDFRYLELINTLNVPAECFSGITETIPTFNWNRINQCIDNERERTYDYFCKFFKKR